MRHVHAADAEFLEAFRDQGVARATAVNTVAVMSRADEIGGGRVDAMFSARGVARRYRADPTVRGLCQNVVAVAGLLARPPHPAAGRVHRARRAGPPAARRAGAVLLIASTGSCSAGRDVDAADRGARTGCWRGSGCSASACRRSWSAKVPTAPPRSPRSWSTAAGCASSSRCCTPSSPSAATCSRPGRRCWRWTPGAPRRRPGARQRPAGRASRADPLGAHEFIELRLLGALRGGGHAARRATPTRRAAARRRTAPHRPPAWASRPTRRRRAGGRRLRGARTLARHTVNPMLGRATTDACRAVVRSCEGILAGLGTLA